MSDFTFETQRRTFTSYGEENFQSFLTYVAVVSDNLSIDAEISHEISHKT